MANNKATYWTNKDGLYVGFGPRAVLKNAGAQVNTDGMRREVVMKIDGALLTATVGVDQLANAPVIPAGSYIEEALLVVNTAFSDVNGELNIGGYLLSGTVDDADGFDATIDVASLVANAEVTCDGSYVGKVLANSVKVACDYDSAAFTDGAATLVITYIPPAN